MAGPIKDFSALKSLRKEIKAQDEARQAAAAETKRREQEARRDADIFRSSIGNVKPLSLIHI